MQSFCRIIHSYVIKFVALPLVICECACASAKTLQKLSSSETVKSYSVPLEALLYNTRLDKLLSVWISNLVKQPIWMKFAVGISRSVISNRTLNVLPVNDVSGRKLNNDRSCDKIAISFPTLNHTF